MTNNMKKLIRLSFILSALCVIINSCTYRITEQSVIGKYTTVPYDSARISRYIKNLTDSNLIASMQNLSNTKINVFYKGDSLTVIRDYLPVNDSITLEYFTFLPQIITQTIYVFSGYGALNVGLFPSLMMLAKADNAKIISLCYSGYGNSSGSFSVLRQFEYNQQFFNLLSNTYTGKISVMGYSMGSLYATRLAVDNEIDNLFLLAPISDSYDMAKKAKNDANGIYMAVMPFVKLQYDADLQQISNVEQLMKYKGKVAIFHAKDDRTLPFSMSEKLYESSISANKSLTLYETGDHGAPFDNDNWKKIIEMLK